ncbi:MAG: DUF1102 domain-containing protein [Archaeoglobales archaeon]|nr:DUF1102 domain-containing protein [Archaeoglobales archaeon]
MLEKGIGMLLLSAAVLVVLGIGADFSDYTAQRSVHIAIVADDQEFINLEPIQPYAYINSAGVLVIDFSENNPNYQGGGKGISPKSEYNFDKVFGVSNDIWKNDSEYGNIIVTIRSDNSSVELYCKDNPASPTGNICYSNRIGGIVAYNSDTASTFITFCLAPGDVKEIGMDLTGPTSVSTAWLNGTLSIHAEPDYNNACGGGVPR